MGPDRKRRRGRVGVERAELRLERAARLQCAHVEVSRNLECPYGFPMLEEWQFAYLLLLPCIVIGGILLGGRIMHLQSQRKSIALIRRLQSEGHSAKLCERCRGRGRKAQGSSLGFGAGRIFLTRSTCFYCSGTGIQWRCPSCSYDLTANASGTCPECGLDVRDLLQA